MLCVALLAVAGLLTPATARIHHLSIANDRRKLIPLSTFGFYSGGKLQVNMTGFQLSPPLQPSDYSQYSNSVLGFSIDKTVSDSLNPYTQNTETACILNKTLADKEKAGIIRFSLDFSRGLTAFRCSKNVRAITILDSPSSEAEGGLAASLSDAAMFNRPKRNLADSERGLDGVMESDMQREIRLHKEQESKLEKEAEQETAANEVEKNADIKSEGIVTVATPVQQPISVGVDSDVAAPVSLQPGETHTCVGSEDTRIELKRDNQTGQFHTSFVIYISDEKLEGLYSMFFHNCLNYQQQGSTARRKTAVQFTINIEERNPDSYLSAGEMPLPALYQMLSVLFFLAGCFWVFILKKTGSEQVFRIHWIMAALVFLKSLSLFFHGVNYNKIATNGIHMESWAVLYYITHLLKGGLLFFTIVLIGSGWAFVKHVLSSNEKKVFMVVLPLQVLSNVAYIILEESEQGEATHNFWKEIFLLIDLVCCGAILLPVVWSIRHLQDASHTDGKAAVSLEKLKLFRHFYIMVVCYVYFTRIIVYLLRITVPFQYEWLDPMFKELTTLVFFVMTGYKFRPATNNPYFAVATDEDMEEVLVGGNALLEQATTRKSYRLEDVGEDDEETVVLFNRQDELSHDLD